MSLSNVFNIAGSALSAQSTRISTISSNLANVDSIGSSPEDVYKARYPVFRAIFDDASESAARVQVDGIYESNKEPISTRDPSHPMADEEGFVYSANINTVEEMVNMMSASRTYQSSVEAMNTSKQLLMQTLNMGK